MPLFSGSSLSSGYGPRRRAKSPPGGSTLITSAPISASILAPNAAEIPWPHSTTLIALNGVFAFLSTLSRTSCEFIGRDGQAVPIAPSRPPTQIYLTRAAPRKLALCLSLVILEEYE